MNKEDFRQWLNGQLSHRAIGDCISKCSRIEQALKIDLDLEYQKDTGISLLANHLQYSIDDERNGIPAPKEFNFKEGSVIRFRMADLRAAANKYFLFLRTTSGGEQQLLKDDQGENI